MNKYANIYKDEFQSSMDKQAWLGDLAKSLFVDPVVGMWDHGKGAIKSIGRGDIAGLGSHSLSFLGDTLGTLGTAAMFVPGLGTLAGAGAKGLGLAIKGGMGASKLLTAAKAGKAIAPSVGIASNFGKANSAANAALNTANRTSAAMRFNQASIDKLQKVVSPSARQTNKLTKLQAEMASNSTLHTKALSETPSLLNAAERSAINYSLAMKDSNTPTMLKGLLMAQKGLGKVESGMGSVGRGMNNFFTNNAAGRMTGFSSGLGFKGALKPIAYGMGVGIGGSMLEPYSDFGQIDNLVNDPEFQQYYGEKKINNLSQLTDEDDKINAYKTLNDRGIVKRFERWKKYQQT